MSVDNHVAHWLAGRMSPCWCVAGPGEIVGPPPMFCFEPRQREQCGFKPDVLLDITPVWERKCAAMQALGARSHLWTYDTDLGRRRGVHARRNSGPNLGLAEESDAEAYQRFSARQSLHRRVRL